MIKQNTTNQIANLNNAILDLGDLIEIGIQDRYIKDSQTYMGLSVDAFRLFYKTNNDDNERLFFEKISTSGRRMPAQQPPHYLFNVDFFKSNKLILMFLEKYRYIFINSMNETDVRTFYIYEFIFKNTIVYHSLPKESNYFWVKTLNR
jgi:hypothetical protein